MVKHMDRTLLKEALETVDKGLENLLRNIAKQAPVDMDAVVTMFTVRDLLRKEQFARP